MHTLSSAARDLTDIVRRYHSVDDTLKHLCARAGATLYTVRVPCPATSQQELASAFQDGLTAAAQKGTVKLAGLSVISVSNRLHQ